MMDSVSATEPASPIDVARMADTHLSVVVPFYDAERHLEACISALLGQTYPRSRYELIMVDNNSRDASAQIVGRYPDIRLLHEPQQGAYSARNRGLSEARGEIVAFTDPDCVPAADWLERLVDCMQDDEVGVAIGGYRLPEASPALALLIAFENAKEQVVFESEDALRYYGHTNNMAVKRRLFEDLGPFVERERGADALFVRRVVERRTCGAVRYCPEARVLHLEVDSVTAFFRKRFVHGRSARSLQAQISIAPLSVRQRMALVARTTHGQRWAWGKRVLLGACAAGSALSWQLGKVRIPW